MSANLAELVNRYMETGDVETALELQSVLSAAPEEEKDSLRARYADKDGSSSELSQEKSVETGEREKFDELIEAVDKFEELAKATKKVEKELKDAEETREEHYSSTTSLGRTVRSDNRRETEFVALKAEVGQKLEEMIALKGDILNKLSDIKSPELRAKIYKRFERKKPDEVGMSSEVKLETKSDGHEDDLRHRALNHKTKDIIGSNLDKIAKRKAEAEKIVVETAPENVDPVVEQEAIIKEEETEKAPEDHLAPGIKIGREEESEILKPEEIQTEPPKDVTRQKAAIDISEQKDQPVVENKSEIEDKPSEPPVEFMEIGSDGELVSVTDSTGEFKEDTIAADLLVDSRLHSSSLSDEAQASHSTSSGPEWKSKAESNDRNGRIESGNDEIKAEVDEVGGKIKTIMGRIDEMRPKESVRKIDDFLPPTSRIKQAAEAIEQSPDQTAASINTSEQMASQVQPVMEPVRPVEEIVEPVVENNPLPEQSIQQNAVPEAKTAEPDDQILTQNIQAAETIAPNIDVIQPEIQSPNIISEQEPEPVQPEAQPETTVPEQKIESVQPVVEEAGNNNADANNNVIDIKPAIEARDAQIEQPAQKQKKGLFGWFGGNNTDRHGAEDIAGNEEADSAFVHSVENKNKAA